MARPVEYARRGGPRALGLVRNLGTYLSQCAAAGLATAEYRAIHPHLRRLQSLVTDYDEAPAQERRTRLEAVRDLLESVRRRHVDGGRRLAADRRSVTRVLDLTDSIDALPGVGGWRVTLFHKVGVRRIEDLLWRLPWRYVDRAATTALGSLRAGQDVTVCGEVRSVEEIVTARRHLRILQAVLGDSSGTLILKWFNQPYLRRQLAPGRVLMCSGRVKGTGMLPLFEMDNPQFEVMEPGDAASLHTARVVPIYHETRGLNSRALRVLVDRALAGVRGLDEECLPADLRARHGLISRRDALTHVHFPPPNADVDQYNAGTSAAHRRLAFEELFLLELGLAVRRRETVRDAHGIAFRCSPDRLERFWAALPYRPTAAQQRVIDEVLRDMAAPRPMNRLIQGDVGCGKTLVAAAAMWIAIGDGYQAAFMAPTELLAEQHFRKLSGLFEGLGLRVGLITSDAARRERTAVRERVAAGEVDCVVGTHALLQPDVRFARFGLAVIDEQHKFGVIQRSHLVRKGYHPDVLIMTATPIPRTLAMTVYGDLDVSVIDELPAGRVPVTTSWHRESQRAAANEAIRRAVSAGHQVYVVAPRIEQSEEEDVRSAIAVAERIRRQSIPGARVGLLHGRMNRAEKDAVMQAFLSRAVNILVATTVVEVGLDVPTATVMVIEHADRYGLAQLHQLRGRVGRGPDASMCLLLSPDRVSDEATKRLETMVAVRDGFVVAERDLALRGPGEFLGTRQSGLPDLKVANLIRDASLVALARQEAFALFDRDPALSEPAHAPLKAALKRTWGTRLALATVG